MDARTDYTNRRESAEIDHSAADRDPFAVQPEVVQPKASDRAGDGFEDALAEACGALGVGV